MKKYRGTGYTHAPETGASFLAPVSGACVIGIRKVKAQRVTVVEFSMYNRSDDGVGCFEINVGTNAAQLTNVIVAGPRE